MKPGHPQLLGSLSLLGAAIIVGVAVAEVGLRIAIRVSSDARELFVGSDPLAILVEPHGEFGYRQRPNRVFHYGNGTLATSNASGFRGPDVATAKPPGTFRIVLLGGSTSHGWGVSDSATIDAYMRRLLAQRYSDRRFEVLNLAFDGYDTWQDLQRLQTDGLPRDPDLVILNSGINDVRNARYPNLVDHDPRTLLWAADMARMREEQEHGGPRPWTLLKHYSYLIRLGAILHNGLAPFGGDGGPTAAVTAYPDAAEYFQRNVDRIAALTARRGIPLLLSTPPSSLALPGNRIETSGRTYWVGDAEATQRYRNQLDHRLRVVADSLAAAGYPAAYVPHHFDVDLFLDDCHLTPEGNARMAEDLVTAVEPFLDARTGSARPAPGPRALR